MSSVCVRKLINNNKAVNTTTFIEKIICFSINNTSCYDPFGSPLGALHKGMAVDDQNSHYYQTHRSLKIRRYLPYGQEPSMDQFVWNQSRNLRTDIKPPSWSHVRRHNVNMFLPVLSSCRSPVVWPRPAWEWDWHSYTASQLPTL